MAFYTLKSTKNCTIKFINESESGGMVRVDYRVVELDRKSREAITSELMNSS